jgi:hydrogenase nickel incorporation protein HypB
MPEIRKVHVMESLLRSNDNAAQALRERWTRTRTLAVNLLSSPGSGKTTLLEATLPRLLPERRVMVLEGDLETDLDAARIRKLGVDARQITTGGACHLDAKMVERAWNDVEADGPFDYLFIENVGNLVCPASYDLGEHRRVLLLSVPEGVDKPAKYAKAFRTAPLLAITKTDLLPHFDFTVEDASRFAREVRPDMEILEVSVRTGEGIDRWVEWLEAARLSQFEPA